jgi:sugar lactone lactonase YvrE
MKRIKNVVATSLLTVVLIGGTSVAASSIAKDGLYSSSDSAQVLTSVNNLAGGGDFGDKDADVTLALFRSPHSLSVLPDGSILVADTESQLIRKISGGKVTTIAGASVSKDKQGFPVGGLLDGKADLSFFNHPGGITADAAGNIYIADSDNNAIRKIDAAGNVTTIAGNGVQGSTDGAGKDARLNHPSDVAITKEGTLYVADTLNNAIRKITADGTVSTLNALSVRTVELVAGKKTSAGDFADGALSQAKFNEPSGLALDVKGNLFVSDGGNQRIRYIDLTAGTVKTVAGSAFSKATNSLYEPVSPYATGDYADGAADHALFNRPLGIAVTSEGGLLIADSLNNSIRYLYQGKVSTVAGEVDQYSGESNGIERAAKFNSPSDVAVAADGSILVADSFNNKIRSIQLYQLPSDLAADDSIKVVLNANVIKFDTTAEISQGRTMVPIREIAEALGYKVTVDDSNQIIHLSNGTRTIELTIGKNEVNSMQAGIPDVVSPIDVAPYITKDNRTLIPVRFFAEQIGLNVQWNSDHNTVILRN